MSYSKPVTAALRLKCGVCNEGKVFERRMQFRDQCEVCGQDFSIADTADGPAYFVGFALLILTMRFAVVLSIAELSLGAKLFGYALLVALTGWLIFVLLPIVKALFLNLQIFHRAGQIKFK